MRNDTFTPARPAAEPVQADSLDSRIARELKALRRERGWSLEQLGEISGVSRATLSRLENAEVSPTASVLGKLCVAFGIAMSRLLRQVEEDFTPLIEAQTQPVWTDPETGFRRRSVSPPARLLAGEVIECEIPAGVRISYDAPPRMGLEHHLCLLAGRIRLVVEGVVHDLNCGDCLRYQAHGPVEFSTPEISAARYMLFLV